MLNADDKVIRSMPYKMPKVDVHYSLMNHTWNPNLGGKISYKVLSKTMPPYKNLCDFGYLCYARKKIANSILSDMSNVSLLMRL